MLERIAFAGISVQDVTETEPMHGWSDRAIARECSGEGGGGKTGVHSHFILFNNIDLPIIALSLHKFCNLCSGETAMNNTGCFNP